jgi:hypothetical protein
MTSSCFFCTRAFAKSFFFAGARSGGRDGRFSRQVGQAHNARLASRKPCLENSLNQTCLSDSGPVRQARPVSVSATLLSHLRFFCHFPQDLQETAYVVLSNTPSRNPSLLLFISLLSVSSCQVEMAFQRISQ